MLLIEVGRKNQQGKCRDRCYYRKDNLRAYSRLFTSWGMSQESVSAAKRSAFREKVANLMQNNEGKMEEYKVIMPYND